MARYDKRHPMAYDNQSQDSQRGWNDDDRGEQHRGHQYDARQYAHGDKDYSGRYGRNPERASHRYEDANAPYGSGSGEKRTIYVTEDYDDDYLNRRLRSGR